MFIKREDRLCQVCHSSQDVEDEQHFLFSCPAYSDVRQKYASLFQQAISVSHIFTNCEPNACGFLRECLHAGNLLYPPDLSICAFLCVVFYLLAICWSPEHCILEKLRTVSYTQQICTNKNKLMNKELLDFPTCMSDPNPVNCMHEHQSELSSLRKLWRT